MISTSESQTYTVARELAAGLEPPVHILLYGDLSAGKTLFSKGLADGFGVTWNKPPDMASSSIHSEPSGPSSTSRMRWPTLQCSAVLAPPWPSQNAVEGYSENTLLSRIRSARG